MIRRRPTHPARVLAALATIAAIAATGPLVAHDAPAPAAATASAAPAAATSETSATAATAGSAATDTAALLAHLERTRALFLASIAGLTPEQWSWKPAPERWSVAECAEHITRTEAFLRGLLVDNVQPTDDAALLAKARGKSDAVLAMIVDRTKRFQAPEPLNPASASQLRSRAEIERDYNFERGRTVQHVSTAGDPTASAASHVAFQELDLAGWVYFQSGHTERHTLQIEEVKASPGFPGA